MKTVRQAVSILSVSMFLTACGGAGDSAVPEGRQLSQTSFSAPLVQQPEAAYTDVIQRLYMGFLGRPADTRGLEFWTEIFIASEMPNTIAGIIAAYPVNARARQLVDAFAQSAESQTLYSGNNAVFINAVYLNLFNRNAEPEGRAFWTGLIDREQFGHAQAVLFLLEGAQNDDAVVLSHKMQAATYFTSQLDTPDEISSYSGFRANRGVHELFSTFTAKSDVETIRGEVSRFISAMAGSDINEPTLTEYVGFNYLQEKKNVPAYNARYAYASRGFNISSGSLSFGGSPVQNVSWRYASNREFFYSEPIAANVSLLSNDVLPAVVMLCQPQTRQGGTQTYTKSTDVLVARSARNLIDASQLAGQTFTQVRDNCATPSDSGSASFDADGNMQFTSRGVSFTLPAAVVSNVLSGVQTVETAGGVKLAFAAYHYVNADGRTAYALVELKGSDGPTLLPDGGLAIWSQE